jgi:hypothetical protein
VAGQIADAIVDYVLDRRSQPYQNRIYFVSELLNITDYNGNPLIPPEVYYGPYPEVAEGEEYSPSSGFTLRRDEFGDVVPQYDFLVDDPWLQEQTQALEDLQGQLGRFADFPGLGRLKSNALTRGMQEPPVEIDEYGREYIPDSPTPIGLRDLFTTFSTGKININTAPAPVIFALLLSCSEDEANNVALDLRDYRNRFQEEIDPEGVDRVEDGSATPDFGQPRRVATEEDEEIDPVTGLPYDGLTDATSGYGMGLDGMDPESLVAPYQDLETNYFTDLRQIELIDGTDGGPIDFVRSDEGVERVSEEAGTLYQRVLADLGKVAVFGSTYFEATLKSKAEAGRRGNTGYLVLRRDPKRKKIEVVMWKTLER